MKFTAGQWQLQPGVQAEYPVQVLETEASPGTLTVHAATRPVRHREDLLMGPLVTVVFTAPAPGVIGVRITHFTGATSPGPHFELSTDPADGDGAASGALPPAGEGSDPQVVLDDGTGGAVLTSGGLSVRVELRGPWRVDFRSGGRRLTGSGTEAAGLFTVTADGAGAGIDPGTGQPRTGAGTVGRHVREQLDLGVDTAVYGLGERFGPFVKNGQQVDVWNADGGTTSDLAYKNVPLVVTNAGFGVFVDHPGRVCFEIGSEHVSRLQFSVPDEELQYYLIDGPTPKDVLRRYTALTGRPAAPPAWSYGLWLSTSFTTDYDEATVTGFVDGMAERGLPLSVFHFDCFWMRAFHWCDFEWDPRTFPDPRGMLERLKAKGLRISVWLNPYVAQRSRLFAEGRDGGYLLRRPDGTVWQTDDWQPGMGVVDFTNPQARQWFTDHLDALLELGVDCFKTDFGERIPTDVQYCDGSDPQRMHNYYTYLYNRTVFDLLRKRRGEGDAVVFARSATAGSQSFPVHWGGDCDATFTGMAQTLRGGLSLAMSGFGFWSHDIGGFNGTPDAEVFKRWIAFGLLSSHSRLHGRESYRVPWLFDQEAVDVLGRFTRLKSRLMPYLLGAAEQVRTAGTPVLRPMVLEFPDDPACTHLDRQYLLGDDVLVAPVMRSGGEVSYYLPAGTWTHLLTGDRVEGPGWRRETHGFDSLPVLARPGSVIPFGAVTDRPEYDYAEGVTLHAHALPDGARVVTTVPDGVARGPVRFVTSRQGDVVRVEVTAADGTPLGTAVPGWRLRLVGVPAVGVVDGGTVLPGAAGDQVGDVPGVLIRADGAALTVSGVH